MYWIFEILRLIGAIFGTASIVQTVDNIPYMGIYSLHRQNS